MGSLVSSKPEGLITPATFGTIVSIFGHNSVESGGPTLISQHNLQQFHSWNGTGSLV
jgi:hypothetical protein